MDVSLSGLLPSQEQGSTNSKASVAKAAEQFEAVLLTMLLKSARSSDASWLGTGSDAASDSAMSYAEEHLAQTLAARGGLGLASMIQQGLDAQAKTGSAANTWTGTTGNAIP